MLISGENGHSPFPWDLPLWQSDYAIFFGVLYLVVKKAVKDAIRESRTDV